MPRYIGDPDLFDDIVEIEGPQYRTAAHFEDFIRLVDWGMQMQLNAEQDEKMFGKTLPREDPTSYTGQALMDSEGKPRWQLLLNGEFIFLREGADPAKMVLAQSGGFTVELHS